jgi:hypothetical protein
MGTTLAHRRATWELDDFLARYTDFAVQPSTNGTIELVGDFPFTAIGKEIGTITETYCLRLQIPPSFPHHPISVWEIGNRIKSDFHHLQDGALCLGSPFQVERLLRKVRTVTPFMEHAVVPYLAGHSHHQTTREMPFGELDHGAKGLLAEFRQLLGAGNNTQCIGFLRLLGMKKRIANKRPCPCGSNRRLGRCHARRLNRLRGDASRSWFRHQANQLSRAATN